MDSKLLTITPVQERKAYLDLLLLADENEEIINSYLYEGELFKLEYHKELTGVCLFTFPSEGIVEIKNIALAESYRGYGLGKRTIQLATEHFSHRRFHQMLVGTSNSSIDNLVFYQKAGFRFYKVIRNFFSSYSDTFYENGIKAVDMVVFEKTL